MAHYPALLLSRNRRFAVSTDLKAHEWISRSAKTSTPRLTLAHVAVVLQREILALRRQDSCGLYFEAPPSNYFPRKKLAWQYREPHQRSTL